MAATYPADTFQEGVELTIEASNQLAQVVRGDANTEVTVADGSTIPSIRKAQADSMYFKEPEAWTTGQTETDYLQLKKYTNPTTGKESWWFAKGAMVSNPVAMGTSPFGDDNWTLYTPEDLFISGKAEYESIYQALKGKAAEAGYNLVRGSFEAGGTLTNTKDVLWYQATGKYYNWYNGSAKTVVAGSTPSSTGGISSTAWVDRTDLTLRGELSTTFLHGSFNIRGLMSDAQLEDSLSSSPVLDYTELVNSAFAKANSDGSELVIDKATHIRISSPITTVDNLTLRLDGAILCDMSDVSSVYVAGRFFKLYGCGYFDGLSKNIRRFIRSPFVDGQSGKEFYVLGSKGRIGFKNAASTTFHRSIDIYDEGVTFQVEKTKNDSVSALENGTIGDLNGSCRAIYVGGSTMPSVLSSGTIADILIQNLLPFEDGDGVHVQSNSTANFDISVKNVKAYNVAKRAVKIQANGVQVDQILARAELNSRSMYSVVSMYGSGEAKNIFGIGKIMNGIDSFNLTGKTLISSVNIQSTQTENEQQACVTLVGGDIDVSGLYGYGCYYALFARSVFADAKFRVSGVHHKSVNYAARLLADSAHSFNSILLADSLLDSSSASLPSLSTEGSILAVTIKDVVCNTSYFYGARFSHVGSLNIDGYSAPNVTSHGLTIGSVISGGSISDVQVGASAAHAAIVSCADLTISNLRGGTYSTLRFDGATATNNKANGIVTGSGSTRSYEQINGASSNIVTGTFPKVASIIYDAASIANGASLSTIVAVDGAKLGDSVTVSLSSSNLGLNVSGYVSSAGNVTVTFYNLTGAAVNLPSLTVSVKVFD